MHKDEVAKKTISILPLKGPGEPAVVSIPISQAKSALSITLRHPVVDFVFNFMCCAFLGIYFLFFVIIIAPF